LFKEGGCLLDVALLGVSEGLVGEQGDAIPLKYLRGLIIKHGEQFQGLRCA